MFAGPDIKLPPSLRFEELKKAECLIENRADELKNMVIVIQSESAMWSIPLSLVEEKLGSKGNSSAGP